MFGLLLLSCGGDDEVEDVNTAPTVPIQVYPLNNTLCIDNDVNFEWNASTDAEGDQISYRIEVSESASFIPLTIRTSTSATSKTISLDIGKSYYWRLLAEDSNNASSGFSTVSQFITEGEGESNHVPFGPSLLTPISGSEIDGTSTSISWSTSDIDNDPLVFDVYLDTNSDPTTKVSENQSETTYNATNLASGTTYYFKIVVKDDKGAASIGQIWNFSTK